MEMVKKIKLETRLSHEDVAGMMDAFSDGLKDGLLKIKKGGDELELTVPRFVDFEVEAKYSPQKARFSVKVSWRPDKAEVDDYPEEAIDTAKRVKKIQTSMADMVTMTEDSFKETAETVSAVAMIASRKVSKSLVKAAGSTMKKLEKTAAKTKKAMEEIKEEAERIVADKKKKDALGIDSKKEHNKSTAGSFSTVKKQNEKKAAKQRASTEKEKTEGE